MRLEILLYTTEQPQGDCNSAHFANVSCVFCAIGYAFLLTSKASATHYDQGEFDDLYANSRASGNLGRHVW
jgi:hypothetical protein